MTATEGPRWLRATQSMPASRDDSVPAPVQSRTFTDRTCAPFATPKSRDAAMPATTVPWPSQSPETSSTVLTPSLARPPNCGWVTSTPVSST